jgi:hypothetical protein
VKRRTCAGGTDIVKGCGDATVSLIALPPALASRSGLALRWVALGCNELRRRVTQYGHRKGYLGDKGNGA